MPEGQLYHLSCELCKYSWWDENTFPNRCPKCGEDRAVPQNIQSVLFPLTDYRALAKELAEALNWVNEAEDADLGLDQEMWNKVGTALAHARTVGVIP